MEIKINSEEGIKKINNSYLTKILFLLFTKEFTLCEYTPNWIISIKKKNFDT